MPRPVQPGEPPSSDDAARAAAKRFDTAELWGYATSPINQGGFMKIELLYLLLTAILTGVLWIPVVIGYVKTRGPLTDENYKVAPTSPLPAWVSRANRAHVNAVENFGPFAAVVLIAHAVGVSTSVTAACAAVYFYARLAHAIVHISGTGMMKARTLLFTIAWIAFLTYAIVVLRHLT